MTNKNDGESFESWYERHFGVNRVLDGTTQGLIKNAAKAAWNHQQKKIDALEADLDLKKVNDEFEAVIEITKFNLKLTKQLKEANEVIEFYGDGNNWQLIEIGDNVAALLAQDCSETKKGFTDKHGGKRAREYKAKYKL
jgi:hypothetical protein